MVDNSNSRDSPTNDTSSAYDPVPLNSTEQEDSRMVDNPERQADTVVEGNGGDGINAEGDMFQNDQDSILQAEAPRASEAAPALIDSVVSI